MTFCRNFRKPLRHCQHLSIFGQNLENSIHERNRLLRYEVRAGPIRGQDWGPPGGERDADPGGGVPRHALQCPPPLAATVVGSRRSGTFRCENAFWAAKRAHKKTNDRVTKCISHRRPIHVVYYDILCMLYDHFSAITLKFQKKLQKSSNYFKTHYCSKIEKLCNMFELFCSNRRKRYI